MPIIEESELIINPDGSVFHLNLLPEDVADTIITVGDPERLHHVIAFLDTIEIRKQKREFATVTGTIKGKRITCISTGIGTDNIDIVINEIDALKNIDFKTRMIKEKLTSLNIIRLGTSGSVQEDIPLDSIVVSTTGIGSDGLMHFYKREISEFEKSWELHINHYFKENNIQHLPIYVSEASSKLVGIFKDMAIEGNTMTHTGFYGPQGRVLRAKLKEETYLEKIQAYKFGNYRITNFEMETASIFGLGNMLGHHCCALNAIIANRALGRFSKQPQKTIQNLISLAVERIATL